jgi:DNA-binding transcriptional ArsR family regulator
MAWLMRWDISVPTGPEAYRRLTEEARFPQAARALATNMLAAAARDRALDGIFKDAGRYVAAMLALYLHVSGGLTLPRLKELCARSGLLSPGRARSLLIYLRYLGYVELFPTRRAGAPARYLPTARFMTAWRAHLTAALEAAAIVEPGAERLLNQLDDPETFNALARLHCEGLMVSTHVDQPSTAFVRVFMHRHAGSQIIATLLAAGDDDVFLSPDPVPFSLAATARRFAVSRVHISRTLDEAEQAGLLRYRDDGTVVLEALGRTEIQSFYAMQLVHLLIAAAATVRERSEVESRRGSDWLGAPPAGLREGAAGSAASHP